MIPGVHVSDLINVLEQQVVELLEGEVSISSVLVITGGGGG